MEPLAVAVVIPTLNEVQSIAAVVAEIPRDLVHEIIIVDGGSSDGTQAAAAAAGARVVTVSGRGYGRACAAGAAAAAPECGIIVFMDGDGADRGDLIARLVDPIRRGEYDFVIASRTRGEREAGSMSWLQLLAGHLAGLGIRALYGVRYTDMCAYRAIRRDCLERLQHARDDLWLEHRNADAGRRRRAAHSRSADALSPPQRGQIQGRRLAARVAAGGLSDRADVCAGRGGLGRRSVAIAGPLAGAADHPVDPPSPRLFVDQAEIAAARERIAAPGAVAGGQDDHPTIVAGGEVANVLRRAGAGKDPLEQAH